MGGRLENALPAASKLRGLSVQAGVFRCATFVLVLAKDTSINEQRRGGEAC
jgi:hypothetical protein